jgi:hypothetical protein
MTDCFGFCLGVIAVATDLFSQKFPRLTRIWSRYLGVGKIIWYMHDGCRDPRWGWSVSMDRTKNQTPLSFGSDESLPSDAYYGRGLKYC